MARGASRATELPSANGGRLSKPSLRALVARAKRGEQAAFEQIYSRYHQDIFRYCRALLGNVAEAEDAMQSTMAAALRALPGEQREIALRPWLFRIAHNEAISVLRARMPGLEAEEGFERTSRSADADAAQRERLRMLVSDLNLLPERQRSALVMRELSDLGYPEIAAALDTSEGAAKQVVFEARTALRTLEQGREMSCEEVCRTLSERDGRQLRGRKLRAHLRACEGCGGFQAAIEQRRTDLVALAPPLPAIAGLGILTSLLGGSAGGGVGAAAGTTAGGAAALAGGGAAGGAAIKGASVLAATVIAAGGAHAGGVVELPLPGGGNQPSAPAGTAPQPPATVAPGERSGTPPPSRPDAGAPGQSRRTPAGHERRPGGKRPGRARANLPPAASPRAGEATRTLPPQARGGGRAQGLERSGSPAAPRAIPPTPGPPPQARGRQAPHERAAPRGPGERGAARGPGGRAVGSPDHANRPAGAGGAATP